MEKIIVCALWLNKLFVRVHFSPTCGQPIRLWILTLHLWGNTALAVACADCGVTGACVITVAFAVAVVVVAVLLEHPLKLLTH